MENPLKTVTICEDHQIVTDGLHSLIDSFLDFEVLDTVSNHTALWGSLEKHPPEILLLDLNLPEKSQATIREVELMIYETPVVYARSIIPSDLTQRKETGLANLGSKPLGHLLFKDGRMRKSRREFTCVEGIFGRRTPYEYEGGTILVNEFFLDALKKYL